MHVKYLGSFLSDQMEVLNPHSKELLGLSDEILVHVLSFLPSGSLINVSKTCRKLQRLSRDNLIVKKLSFRSDFDIRAETYDR